MKIKRGNKWLFFLSLFFAPVMGETVINASGLPTPGPIALISASITFIGILIGILTVNKRQQEELDLDNGNSDLENDQEQTSEQLKVGPLSAISSTITATRCSAALFGSFISLIVYGLSGFQFPELAGTASLGTVIYFATFRSKLTRLLEKVGQTIRTMGNRGTVARSCYRLSRACGDTEQQQGCAYVLGLITQLIVTLIVVAINLVITFNIISPPVSYFGNIVSLAMYSDLYNFPKSAQFITTCKKTPVTSGHTIAQCTPYGNAFNCFLDSKDIRIIDIFIRVLGIILPFVCFVPVMEGRWGRKFGNKSEQSNERKPGNETIKEVGIKSSIIIFGVTAFYLVAMASIQAKGLNIQGLESCNIDRTLISSKTGYLQEGGQQELVPLKQFSLT